MRSPAYLRRPLWIAVVVLLLVALATGCASQPPAPTAAPGKSAPAAAPAAATAAPAAAPAAPAKTYNWKLYQHETAAHIITKTLKQWSTEIDQKTNGQLKIAVYSANEMPYKPTETYDIVKAGNVELGAAPSVYVAGSAPLITLVDLPYLFDITAPGMLDKVFKAAQPVFEKVFLKFNAMPLTSWPFPEMALWTKPEMRKLDDVKGKRMRSFDAPHSKMLEIMGAMPVTMVAGEVLTSLQRGAIEGAVTSANTLVASGWNESMKYSLKIRSSRPNVFLVVGKDAYASLPPNLQSTLRQVSESYGSRLGQMMEEESAQNFAKVQKDGMVISEISAAEWKALRAKMSPVWDDWVKVAGPEGQDAMKMIRGVIGE